MRYYYHVLLVSLWIILFSLLCLRRYNENHISDTIVLTGSSCEDGPRKEIERNATPTELKVPENEVKNEEELSRKNPSGKNPIVQEYLKKLNAATEPVKPTTSIPYDPNDKWKWEGDVDYDKIAAAALRRFNGEDEDSQPFYVVYNVDSTVGFANQFRALSGIFLIAVVSGRRLRINWGDYYDVMDSYFTPLRYSMNETKYIPFKTYMSYPRGVCNMTKYSSHDVDQIFGKRHISFRILTDLSCFVLPNPKYREVLKRLGFDINDTPSDDPINGEDYMSIRRQIARLLLTPNSEITYVIRKNLQNYQHPIIGTQIRTGGSLSTSMETHRFLYISSMSYVNQEIKYAMQKYKWTKENVTLFISTDSGVINRYLRNSHSGMRILDGVGYKCGHSSSYFAGGQRHQQFLKRAILDLVLLSQTDYILFTHGSSYGKLAMRLAYNVPGRALCRESLCTPFS